MTDQFKKVQNPLFSAAVTGGTFEDFSQNAVLLPAKKKTPPLILNVSHEQLLSDILPRPGPQIPEANPQDVQQTSAAFFVQETSQASFLESQPEVQQQIFATTDSSTSLSGLSSVFSSFSNILQVGSPEPKVQPSVAPLAGLNTIPNQTPANAEPVPLFPPAATPLHQNPPPPPTSGEAPVNIFRRSGLKRPTYAPVPGLSNPTVQNIPSQSHPQFPSSLQTSNQNVSSAFSHQNLPNQFKPISPPPPSFNNFSQIPQPQPYTFPANPPPGTFPLPAKTFQSPVMSDIPASEAMTDALNGPNPNLNNEAFTASGQGANQTYRPVYHHWFFCKEIEGKKLWMPFSMLDSLALEQAFTSNDLDPDKVIATDGGRYDVNILRRERTPIYWKGSPTEVRRCSWFHKGGSDSKLKPYEENIATKLEEEFKTCFETNQWHKQVELASGEKVVLHGPDVMVLFPSRAASPASDAWGNTPNQTRPRVVKRGMDEFDIDEGEPAQVDHILFMVHGIGSVCDFKFRSVEEVVDEFRNIALQLVRSHYRTSSETGVVHRVEVLPISWHGQLHSDETGIDQQLKNITLESIPKLRDFTNDTILDVLFYTSPVFCQNIISTVGNELNRVYSLFQQRNPRFSGGVSLGGHSLGSLILFDLLCHQSPPVVEKLEENLKEGEDIFPANQTNKPPAKRKISRRISYLMGSNGTGQPQIFYPHLNFEPNTFFALGSPIGMFVIIRGLDTLGNNFSLPTCPGFFNIFHPYDPIAYRIESLINLELGKIKPVLIPHHKGRKRMHLELKETMARVGADLKEKIFKSMKSTWNSVYQLAMFHKADQPSLEEEVQKALEERIEEKSEEEEIELPTQQPINVSLGSLNKGRRVDYVLQEAPLEFFNEYIFALTSHVCYWESEDTILLMLKEIYSSIGIATDSQIPQQTMTIERPPSLSSSKSNLDEVSEQSSTMFADLTKPMQVNQTLQPPPTAGFIRKT